MYAITYKDFKGVRHIMIDDKQALIFTDSDSVNLKSIEVQDRLSDLLDGSPVKVRGLFKSEIKRIDYPREKIAFWRQCLQTLEVVPYDPTFKKES